MNVSVGRGTPVPFRWVGAPWIDSAALLSKLGGALLDGVEFSAQDYTPSKSVFQGAPCHGVRITITDRERLRPTLVFLELHKALRELYADKLDAKWPGVKSMVGTAEYQAMLGRGASDEALRGLFEDGAAGFAKTREPFLLY
jgi:uncharacterized protein YbbC (DUF1343 family)